MRSVSFAVTPMEPVFRRMVAVSVVLHVVAFAVFVAWAGLHSSSNRFLSVTVVDLVGGQALPAPQPVREKAAPPAPAPAPKAKAVKEKAKAPAPPPVREKAAPAKEKRLAPDTASVAATLKRMREERSSTERLRRAVVALRREKEVRSAVRQVGERVAHRIDLSAARPSPQRAAQAPAAGMSGAKGKARMPPEYLAYFRLLDEKIRSNWTVPEITAGEKEKLMVQLRIVIEKNGQVSQVRMEKSSGNPYFDDSVRRAINKASPLPVPPEQLRGGEDHYEVGFRFYGAGGAS